MPSERCSDGIFYGFGFDFNLFCLKYRLKTRIATRHYSGLTKIRTKAAKPQTVQKPIHLVLQTPERIVLFVLRRGNAVPI
ncbi:transposase [Neisseria meningitidis]|uniref:transposase n=1 Tax=Neisseria meningitidis TaxID=487 RepID=UPI001E3D79F9|nr:transposase [Neisseria meningitidis]